MSEPLRRVFLPVMLERLAALITEQGEEAMAHSDIGLPPRTAQTLMHLAKHAPTSAADVAKAFNQPHQLATQRIDLLLELGLITRVLDREDARRKLLKLTPKGKAKVELLATRLGQAEKVFAEFFDEIGCDLAAFTTAAIEALERRPLVERGPGKFKRPKPKD